MAVSFQGVATVGDAITTGHLCEGVSVLAGPGAVGTTGVYVNSKPVCRVGDLTAPHLSGVPPVCVSHTMPIASGKTTVIANGMPIARIGDSVDSGVITSGSANVLA